MKKTTIFIFLFCITAFCFCSCTKNTSEDVYFIHVVAFDEQNSDIRLLTVTEKQSGKDSGEKKEEYFISSAKGNSISECIEKFRKQYKNCYFAASEIYLFSENLSSQSLYDITAEICQSSTLPTKSRAVYLKNADTEAFLKAIKGQEQIKLIFSKSDTRKHSFIRFAKSFCDNGETTFVPVFSLDDNGKIIFTDYDVFNYGNKEVSQNK